MSRFGKKFICEGRGIFSRETTPRIYLGCFGKHPGWDDHLDDIGLETESLQLAKQILYVEGIGGQINAGEWEKLTETQALSGFEHILAWKREEAFLLGKIWSSRDGKNRTKYPMVACLQAIAVPFHWALQNVLPVMERLEAQCKEVLTADEVRAVFHQAHEELRGLVGSIPAETSLPAGDGAPFAAYLGLEDPAEALYRILYLVHTQMARFRSGDGAGTPVQIRLPAAVDLPAETVGYWCQFLESQLGKDVPILLTLPTGQPWLDATVGEPGPREFYALRAGPEILTLASAVPYTLTPEFREENRDLIQAFLDAQPGATVPAEKRARAKKWFA
jgi:hypothetical protein